mmetsp:Transcript_10169/g.22911  ORF Transcript_10169/g.22911 Transcript_10169/m.22911 type:complete len:227 (+) Transcript_10169:55-735(+)
MPQQSAAAGGYNVSLRKEQLPTHIAPPVDRAPTFTMDDVAKHNTENDGWVVIDGKVYDITNFIKHHPGNWCGCQISTIIAIKRSLGTDCTEEFHEIHTRAAKSLVPQYFIGNLAGRPKPTSKALSLHRSEMASDRLCVSIIGPEGEEDVASWKLDPLEVTVAQLRRLARMVMKVRMNASLPANFAVDILIGGVLCDNDSKILADLGVTLAAQLDNDICAKVTPVEN